MTAYIGVDGTARKIAGGYVGVDGVARKITKAYIGVDGVAKLWFTAGGGPAVFEIEKVTSDTYAGSVAYTGEQFLLVAVYPKPYGLVSVTYGGLTKVVEDTSGKDSPNPISVFFGTFSGVSDEVETPQSGKLTVSGDYFAVGTSTYNSEKLTIKTFDGFRKIVSFGESTYAPALGIASSMDAFPSFEIPASIMEIQSGAFSQIKTQSVTISGAPLIGTGAFDGTALRTVTMKSKTPPVLKKLETSGTEEELYNNFGYRGAGYVFVLEAIYVPKGCADAYKSATGWSTFAQYIREVG